MYKLDVIIDGTFAAELESEDVNTLLDEIEEFHKDFRRPENIDTVSEAEFLIYEDTELYTAFLLKFNSLTGMYEMRVRQ